MQLSAVGKANRWVARINLGVGSISTRGIDSFDSASSFDYVSSSDESFESQESKRG